MAVDSAWSQAQAFGSDGASSHSQRLHEILNESTPSGQGGDETPMVKDIDENFYNPMPMKQFSKHYQPSLAFSSVKPISYDRPGIEMIGEAPSSPLTKKKPTSVLKKTSYVSKHNTFNDCAEQQFVTSNVWSKTTV